MAFEAGILGLTHVRVLFFSLRKFKEALKADKAKVEALAADKEVRVPPHVELINPTRFLDF